MNNFGIIGTGFYVPSKVLSNKDLEKMVDTTDEWIYSKTGIKERRIADPHECTSDMAIYAALEAMRDANIHAEDIDLIVVATSSPDMMLPSTASIVQGKLGATNAAAFDVSAVCTGFVYALTVAYGMLKGLGQYKKALIIGAETYSRIIDWQDRNTCVFFGDGAGAVILGEVDEEYGIKSTFLGTDGTNWDVARFLGGGSRYPTTVETINKNMHKFEMEGKKVWDFALDVFPSSVKKVAEQSNIDLTDIDKIISHQANINIIKECMKKLDLPFEKTFTNIEKYGNTSGASVPIALADADDKKLLNKGDDVVLVAFGGGLTYGAIHLKWCK
jgi:3-oxoacyl-[acyl-carrier-protein] synthase-3